MTASCCGVLVELAITGLPSNFGFSNSGFPLTKKATRSSTFPVKYLCWENIFRTNTKNEWGIY
jgi:hypothetical protein